MGIYISGVKGLPEQVQKNKEDIKDIQDEIEGIDWDSIHNLENQVAENTQDIDDLQQGQGVQDTAINGVSGRVSTLEGKTAGITRDSVNGITNVNEDLNVEGDLTLGDAKAIVLGTDGHNSIISSGNANSGFEFDSNDNPVLSTNNNKYVFKDTGIELNGTPIGGGSSLYQHNIKYYRNFSTSYWILHFTIINNNSNTLTYNGIVNYLYNNQLYNINKRIMCTGSNFDGSTYWPVIGLYATSTELKAVIIKTSDGTETFTNQMTNDGTIYDTVVQIA